jgi:hypothetical protein
MQLPDGVTPEMAKKIQKIYSSGRMTIGAMAKRLGWPERRVRACLPDDAVSRGYPKAWRKPKDLDRVNELWSRGLNNSQIAEELGLSRQSMTGKMNRIREWNRQHGVENGPHPQD